MNRSIVRQTLAAAAGTALLAIAAGAVVNQVAAAAPAEISIQGFAFTPKTLTVAAGTAVSWVNNDDEPHNIVNADPGHPRLFRSPGLDGGDKFTFVFEKPGTYRYICAVHPNMEGTVVVK
jgi:plastocyanin